MSHIKAWYEVDVCSWNGGICKDPENMSGACDSYECERSKRVISDFCKHVRQEERFIERDYKTVSAEPYWRYGYWELHAGRACYLCSFLEIDGRVVCDQRKD